MVTDYKKTIELFKSLGIGFDEGKEPGRKRIYLQEGQEKIKGYALFCAVFSYDENGKFIDVGIWE